MIAVNRELQIFQGKRLFRSFRFEFYLERVAVIEMQFIWCGDFYKKAPCPGRQQKWIDLENSRVNQVSPQNIGFVVFYGNQFQVYLAPHLGECLPSNLHRCRR